MKRIILFAMALGAFASCATLKTGEYSFRVVTTQDACGRWFDSTFVKPSARASLLAVENVVEPMRGSENVVLVDAGNMGGNGNAAFYYENVAKKSILPEITDYLGYDALLPEKSYFKNNGVRFVAAPLDEARAYAKKHKAHVVIAEVDGNRFDKDKTELDGIDILIAHNDGRTYSKMIGNTLVIDAGRGVRKAGSANVILDFKGRKLVGKKVEGGLVSVDSDVTSKAREHFNDAYAAVTEFSHSVVGHLDVDLDVKEAFNGQSDYINFYQSLALGYPGVDLCFSSFLALDGKIAKGDIVYNDIIKTLYPFDNRITVLSLSGEEVRMFLEASYDLQIQFQTGAGKPSPANFEFGGGINYTVDVNKPFGERVVISSFADGRPFALDKRYNVAMTSYRALGAGWLLDKAGLKTTADIKARVVEEGPYFKTLLYEYLKANPNLTRERISDPKVVGEWKYIR